MTTRLLRCLRTLLLAPLVVVGVGVGIAHFAVPPVQAASLTASLVYDIGASNLVASELSPIDLKLRGTFEFYRGTQKEAWNCIKELNEFDEDRNETPDPEPLAPRVRVDVRVSRATRLEPESDAVPPIYSGDYTVQVTLTVRGQGQQMRSEPVEPADLVDVTVGRGGTEREDLERIATVAARLLNDLMGTFTPCVAKAKVKIRGDTSLPSLNQTMTVHAEGELTLREDGTTEAVFPVTAGRVQSGACSITTTATGRLQVSGGYRPEESALALQLRLSLDPETGTGSCVGDIQCVAGGGTITCTGPGGRASQPAPGLELDLTRGGALAIALANQASVALPRPQGWPEILSWDATLDLEYGGGGAGVAASDGAVAIVLTP